MVMKMTMETEKRGPFSSLISTDYHDGFVFLLAPPFIKGGNEDRARFSLFSWRARLPWLAAVSGNAL
jgi:hypothetical protein